MWGGGVWSAACETRWKTERGRYKTGVGGIREMERERRIARKHVAAISEPTLEDIVEGEEERDKKERKKGKRNKRGEGR